MAAYAVQNISRTGLTPAYVSVSASDTFTPGNQVFIHVKNAGASPDTVAVVTPAAADPPGLVISDISVSVTNGQERMIGPFPTQYFADASISGSATVTHSFTTSVTAGAFTLTQP